MQKIKNVVIVGLGAIGAAYAKQIEKNNQNVNLYGITSKNDFYEKNSIYINGEKLNIKLTTYEDLSNIDVDLIIVSVKSYHLESVIPLIKTIVKENTLVLSFLNGVSSEIKLIQALGEQHILYSTIMQADTHREKNKINCESIGIVLFGDGENNKIKSQSVTKVQDFFEESNIPYRFEENIKEDLWRKLMINAGCNQTSTVYQMNYGKLRADKKALEVMRNAQREVIQVANKCGFSLSEKDIIRWEGVLKNLSYNGRSSMLQDFWSGNELELDIFAEYICKLGDELDVDVTVNKWLDTKIKELVAVRNSNIKDNNDKTAGINYEEKNISYTSRKIEEQLRMDIIGQVFKSGDKLSENQLAKRFNTNRSAVRNALQVLSNEGLILTHPNGRREVVEFGAKQVKDLYEFRCLIEKQALKLILEEKKKNPSVFPKLASMLYDIESCSRMESYEVDWYALDVMFHRELVKSANNLFLSNAWESNVNIIYSLMNFNVSKGYKSRYSREFFEKHRVLYELILTNNEDCIKELEKHIIDAESIASSVLQIVNLKN